MRFALICAFAVSIYAAPALADPVAGTTSGTFVNPTPSGATVTGVGTSDFTYGQGSGSPPNELTFTGTAFSSALETPFKIGSLQYFNGATAAGTEANSVDVDLVLNFTTPSLPSVSDAFTLNFVFTTNTDDPDASADYVYFPSTFGASEFVIDGTTYRVALTGFQNIVGDGFLTSDSTSLHVREGGTASADLYALVTSRTAVPEPATWSLMLAGFGLIGMAARRSRKRPAGTVPLAA